LDSDYLCTVTSPNRRIISVLKLFTFQYITKVCCLVQPMHLKYCTMLVFSKSRGQALKCTVSNESSKWHGSVFLNWYSQGT